MPRPELTDSDWREIYYALLTKARRLRDGLDGEEVDPELDVAAWAAHLEEIAIKIGADGQDMLDEVAYDTKPAIPEFVVALPTLDKKSHEPVPDTKTDVKIRTHDDSLEIQVEDGLKLILEREDGMTRVFVIPTDGADECAYIEATDDDDRDDAQVIITNSGGMVILDSEQRQMNYGPPLWRDSRNNIKELPKLERTHLVSIMRMCMRVARYFGGANYLRMLPMIFLSLEAEARRRGISSTEWENGPHAHADWNKGLDLQVRSKFGICVLAYTDTIEQLHAVLTDAGQQITNRSVHSAMDARCQFWGFYDPNDAPAQHSPQLQRSRVVTLIEGQELPRNDGS